MKRTTIIADLAVQPPAHTIPYFAFIYLLGYALLSCASTGSTGKITNAEHTLNKISKRDEQPSIAQVRHSAEALLMRRTNLEWRRWVTGEDGDDGGLNELLQRDDWLLSVQTIARVETKINQLKQGAERQRLRHLRGFLLAEYLQRATAALDDHLFKIKQTLDVTLNGKTLAYHDLHGLLAKEKNVEQRRHIARAMGDAMNSLNPILRQQRKHQAQALDTLGYNSYVAVSNDIRLFDLRSLQDVAESILISSQETYSKALAQQTQRALGITPSEMRHADIPFLMRNSKFERFFKKDKMLPAMFATLATLGIKREDLAIHIDTKPLPNKNPRAACFPVSIPADIRLSIKPVGGTSDYKAMWHEMGHALQYAHTTSPWFESQQLGDNTVGEVFAFLFDELVEDPAWLKEKLGMGAKEVVAYQEGVALQRLYMVRRYAAKVLYELELHDHSFTSSLAREGAPIVVKEARDDGWAKRRYAQLLTLAYGFPVDESGARRYLLDHDAFFYSADYLRAWMLTAQLRTVLERRFGEPWWQFPDAGAYIRVLWQDGHGLSGEALADKIGVQINSADQLLAQFNAILNVNE